MKQVNIRQAKTQLSKLLRRVAAGEEISITKRGVPVARLVPVRVGDRSAASEHMATPLKLPMTSMAPARRDFGRI
jgi:prevent-host-death family protein